MYKGIYIALSGAVTNQSQMDVISHNLANAQTLGYKKEKISFSDFLLSQLNGGPEFSDGRTMSTLSGSVTDLSSGNLIRTGNPLDVALDGPGFLSLEGGQYTRRGDLTLSPDRYLVTQTGRKVLGSSGPIQLPQGKVEIGTDGGISVDGVQVDKIKVADFKDPGSLSRAGEYFVTTDAGTPSKAGVKQGYLEASNVDVIGEMVGMITALREYETFEKAVHAFDDSMGKVTNDLAKI